MSQVYILNTTSARIDDMRQFVSIHSYWHQILILSRNFNWNLAKRFIRPGKNYIPLNCSVLVSLSPLQPLLSVLGRQKLNLPQCKFINTKFAMVGLKEPETPAKSSDLRIQLIMFVMNCNTNCTMLFPLIQFLYQLVTMFSATIYLSFIASDKLYDLFCYYAYIFMHLHIVSHRCSHVYFLISYASLFNYHSNLPLCCFSQFPLILQVGLGSTCKHLLYSEFKSI